MVVAALARQPDTRLAARSDPFIVDRQLSGRIHAHQAVLAGQPPDRAADLAVAEQELAGARARQANLEAVAAQTAERLDGLGARSVLTAYGRAERRRWQTQLAADRDAVEQAKAARIDITSTVERLRREQTLHECFERIHGWRRTEIVELQDRLDHHWAEVIAACVRADDPLAYGIDRLRHARGTVAGDLNDLNATIPVDRDGGTSARPDDNWPSPPCSNEKPNGTWPTPKPSPSRPPGGGGDAETTHAITTAGQEVDRQQQRLQQTVAAQSDLKQRFSQLVEHQHHRGEVLAETQPRRVELSGALSEIDGALDRTRPGRVQALTEARAEHLIDLLGAPPDHPTNRALWQHLANVVETHLDQQLPAPTWETLRPHLRQARELIADQAAPTHPPPPPAQPTPGRLAAQEAIAMHRQTIQLNVHAQDIPGAPTPDLGL